VIHHHCGVELRYLNIDKIRLPLHCRSRSVIENRLELDIIRTRRCSGSITPFRVSGDIRLALISELQVIRRSGVRRSPARSISSICYLPIYRVPSLVCSSDKVPFMYSATSKPSPLSLIPVDILLEIANYLDLQADVLHLALAVSRTPSGDIFAPLIV
jgi:hypothetical protein